MRVLAIDTALAACSTAVFDSGTGILAHESEPMQRGHAEALLPMVARVMAAVRMRFDDLDRIAVTIGPGSFTGLRVGVAAARAIALSTGKPAVGVTTLAAFAAPALARGDVAPVLAVVDARHAHVFMQVFRPDRPPDAACLAPVAEAAGTLAGRVHLAGNAVRLVLAARPADAPPPLSEDQADAPHIVRVARLGASLDPALNPPKPFYLRPADARPQSAASFARQ